jgi:hypothetical protein
MKRHDNEDSWIEPVIKVIFALSAIGALAAVVIAGHFIAKFW